jgi:site-specific recombinase XerC
VRPPEVDAFVVHLLAAKGNLSTVGYYQEALLELAAFLCRHHSSHNWHWCELDRSTIGEYLNELREVKKNAEGTIKPKMGALRKFIEFLCPADSIALDAVSDIGRGTPFKSPPRLLTKGEMDGAVRRAATGSAPERDVAILELYNTRELTLKQIQMLDQVDVDLQLRCVRVCGEKSHTLVRIRESVCDALSAYLRRLPMRGGHSALFTAPYTDHEGRISRRQLQRIVAKHVCGALLPPIPTTLPPQQVRRAKNVLALQDMLGHASLRNTAAYLDLLGQDDDQELDRVADVDDEEEGA